MVATFNYDLDQKARMLLESARRGGLPVVMPSPPTVTDQGNVSTVTGPALIPDTDPVFRYLGSVPFKGSGAPGGKAVAGNVTAEGLQAGYRIGGILNVSFATDAPQFEWQTYRTGGKYRIFVDGQAVALTPTTLPGGFATTNIKVDFGSSAQRNIRLELGKVVPFIGVKVPNNHGIWATGGAGLRGLIVGDSYADGLYGDATQNQHQAFALQVGHRLGLGDWWISGVSGEGYAKAPTQTGVPPRLRMAADVVAYAPDIVVVCLGVNDWDRAAATVQAEVTAMYAALLAQLPDAIVTVIGPWRAPTIIPPQAINDAIKAGVAAQAPAVATKRIQYVDTFAENWQQVAGRVGATSGVGNSNLYIGADGGHPVQAGHDFLAKRVADAIIRHAEALVAG